MAMFLWVPNVFAAENITIESATLTDKYDNVSEISEPTLNGLNIGFDLSFSQVNDYAKYKVVINNPTSEDYEVSKSKEFSSSDYLSYTYTFDGESKVVKAKEKLTMYITITYKTAVPSDKLTDGKYIETNAMTINLSNETETITNPKTGDNSIIIISILLISIFLSLILYKTTKNKKYLNVMILSLILIPVEAYALEKLQVNVTTKATIEEKYSVGYLFYHENLYTDAELEHAQKTEYTDCSIVYIGSDKYNYCDMIIVNDEQKYKAGEKVLLNTQKYKRIGNTHDLYPDDVCEWIHDEDIQNNTFMCPNDTMIIEEKPDSWIYEKKYSEYVLPYGYTYMDSDKETMNFQLYDYDDWDRDKIFVVYPQQLFTMPKHNIIFVDYNDW